MTRLDVYDNAAVVCLPSHVAQHVPGLTDAVEQWTAGQTMTSHVTLP